MLSKKEKERDESSSDEDEEDTGTLPSEFSTKSLLDEISISVYSDTDVILRKVFCDVIFQMEEVLSSFDMLITQPQIFSAIPILKSQQPQDSQLWVQFSDVENYILQNPKSTTMSVSQNGTILGECGLADIAPDITFWDAEIISQKGIQYLIPLDFGVPNFSNLVRKPRYKLLIF